MKKRSIDDFSTLEEYKEYKKQYNKEWHEKNRRRRLAYMKEYYQRNKLKQALNR